MVFVFFYSKTGWDKRAPGPGTGLFRRNPADFDLSRRPISPAHRPNQAPTRARVQTTHGGTSSGHEWQTIGRTGNRPIFGRGIWIRKPGGPWGIYSSPSDHHLHPQSPVDSLQATILAACAKSFGRHCLLGFLSIDCLIGWDIQTCDRTPQLIDQLIACSNNFFLSGIVDSYKFSTGLAHECNGKYCFSLQFLSPALSPIRDTTLDHPSGTPTSARSLSKTRSTPLQWLKEKVLKAQNVHKEPVSEGGYPARGISIRRRAGSLPFLFDGAAGHPSQPPAWYFAVSRPDQVSSLHVDNESASYHTAQQAKSSAGRKKKLIEGGGASLVVSNIYSTYLFIHLAYFHSYINIEVSDLNSDSLHAVAMQVSICCYWNMNILIFHMYINILIISYIFYALFSF